jgi:hypothetical protein
MLGEIFVQDIDDGIDQMWSRGEIEQLGAEHVYMNAPRTVVRCCHCEVVLPVITERGDGFVVGFQETMWLEIGRDG